MRFGLKNSFFKIFAAAVFGILPQTGAEAYNLAPQSFENFYAVAAEGDLQGLKNMQRRGLNMDATNQNGDTAVCVAVKKQDYLAYKTLIRAGAKSHPACLEKIPEYAHKSFLANYNQKYAAPETPTNWTKNSTALVIGGGIAAGVVALVGVGGGGSGGGHSDEVHDAKACDLNPCAPGCYQNTVCAAGFECTQYESKCNLGCIKCEQKPECLNARECAPGCYVDLTCQEGYECSSRNRCGGCESCRQKTECQKNQCAAGCFRNLNCGSDKTCTLQNGCGGCEKCELVDPDKPDTSNARHCLVYDHSINYCTTCRDGYVSINGTCKLAAPDNCKTYSYNTEKCTECDDGYKLESEGRKCTKDGNGTTTCTAANYPLTTKPANATSESCVDGSTTRYKITSCDKGYNLSSDKKSCTKGGTSGGGNTDPACDINEYPLDECPFTGTCERCGLKWKLIHCRTDEEISDDGLDCVRITTKQCTAENYPLINCTDHGNCKSCSDASGTYRKRLDYCDNGYEMNAEKTKCYPICSAAEYPFSECPANANCKECTGLNGITIKGITSCKINYQLSNDGKSCEKISNEQCTAENYPLESCPDYATCSECHEFGEGGGPLHVKILSCKTGFELNDDSLSCVKQNPYELECNNTNFPLSNCPYFTNCSECTDGSLQTHYRFSSCAEGYQYDPDKETCTNIQTYECTAADYPLAKCADNMECTSCEDIYGVEHNKFSSCHKGFKRSEDGLSCVRDENFKCDTSYYNVLGETPNPASLSSCTDTEGTHYHINKCLQGSELNENGTDCVFQGNSESSCDPDDYPFTDEEAAKVPYGYLPNSCKDANGNLRYAISGCQKGFQLNDDSTACIPSGSCNEIYFPITNGCPLNAFCMDCNSPYGIQRYQIAWCAEGLHISDDKTKCLEGCDLERYNLSSCPNGADCDNCTDSLGTHYYFNQCQIGYNQTSDQKCVAQELHPRDSDVVNDDDISVSSISDKTTVSVTIRTDPNNDNTRDETFNIAFNNKDQPKGNLYNAQNKDASITVDSSSGVTNGLGSVSDISANIINGYGGHKGTLKMNYGGGNGIIGRGNIYNAYKDSTGIIEVSNTEVPANKAIGIYTWNSFLDDYKENKSKYVTNGYGANSNGKITVNSTVSDAYGIYVEEDHSVINGYNGGIGTIEITSSEKAYGIYAKGYGIVYNGYSTDGSKSKGTIILNGSGIAITAGKDLTYTPSSYNGYGQGAEGRIICNGSCSAVFGANGINGGYGYIEINVNEDNGKASGVNSNNEGNGIGKDSRGEVVINMKGKNGSATGVGNNNGSLDGGIGTITINDTGGNNILGLNGGSNFKGSSINITSVANNDKTIKGIFADKGDVYNPHQIIGENHGELNIKSTGSATIEGMTENYDVAINGKRYDKINEGTISIIRDYTEDNAEGSPDKPTSVTYGMKYSNLTNKGIIKIEGPKTLGKNQYDYLYGMFNNYDNKVLLNYGTIDVSGGYKRYAMYNGSNITTSFNYGTAIGDLYNVSNAAGGKLYGKIIGDGIKGLVNGDKEHIATSVTDQDKGYIEYTLSGDDTAVISGDSIYSNKTYNFTNYGVINAFNKVSDGIAYLANDYSPTNYGYIKITNLIDGATVSAIKNTQPHSISNQGTLEVVANNTNNVKLYGIMKNPENLDFTKNIGTIKIDMTGNNNTAYGIYSKSNVVNKGDITITSANKQGAAYGIYIDGHNKSGIRVENYGNITLTDVNPDTSYGIYAVNGASVYNKGKITINDKSTTENTADGKFIYIDATSQIVNNGFYAQTTAFDTAALGGGKFVLGKDGKITAPEIKGDITADAGITSGGFDKTYSSENAFSGKTDEVKLNSGSALFDATLKDNDLVMTMKDFDEVVDDKSLAAYLQRNYEAKRNEQLFNSLKLQTTSARLNSSLNQQLGFSLLPNFAQENMNVFRSLSNLVTDTMFAQDLTNERMMVGYDYLGQDRSSKGRVTGYENTANSSYFLADTKLNNRQRFGLGVALTRFNSDYDDDSTRKATFAQALGSYMHDFGNRWKYAGLLRVGYADGDYKRQSDNERVSGDTSDILYGFNNELRYNYDLGFMTLEPQVELNAYGYYQRKIKENDEKISALLVDGTNNLSIEAGAGLYAGKETVYGETGRVKARLGGSYYRELSQPYHTMRARVRDTDGYYLIESTDIFDRNRVIVRADITFSWKALDFYLRGSQFMENKHTTVINAGIKFNF